MSQLGTINELEPDPDCNAAFDEQYLHDLEIFRNSRSKPADHPVLAAASRGDIKELNTIYKQDPVCLRQKFEWGWTAAHFAGACGQDEMLSFLAGIDPDLLVAKNDYGLTPMHYAAANGQIHAVKLLARKMPQLLEMQANDGRTSLDMARQGNCRNFLLEEEQRVAHEKEKARDRARKAAARQEKKGCMVALLEMFGLMSPEPPPQPTRTPKAEAKAPQPVNPRERGESFDFARVLRTSQTSSSRHFDSQVV